MIIHLVRRSTGADGTFGRMTVIGEHFLVTAEPPWKDNQRSISCIPCGEYECEKVDSPKFGNVYHIKDVPGRTHILIHAGNFAGGDGLRCDTYGCVLVGMHTGVLCGQRAITSSRKALDRFHKLLENKPFTLVVSEI